MQRLLRSPTTKRSRGLPGDLAEHARELELVDEADVRRDLAQRFLGAEQQRARGIDAQRAHELHRRLAGSAAEEAVEVEAAEPGDRGEIVEVDRLGEVLARPVAYREHHRVARRLARAG